MKYLAVLLLIIPSYISGQSSDAEYYRLEGNILRDEGEYAKAQINYLISQELNPYNWLLYSDKGQMCFIQKDYLCAIEEFMQALKLAPHQEKFYHSLGRCYLELGKNEDAISNFSTWIDMTISDNGTFAGQDRMLAMFVYSDRALAYLYSGNLQLACEDWYHAKELRLHDASKFIDQYCQ